MHLAAALKHAVSMAFRCYFGQSAVSSYAAVDRKSIHKPVVLFSGYVTRLIGCAGPLELAVSQPVVKETVSVAFEYEPFDPVFSSPAEEE